MDKDFTDLKFIKGVGPKRADAFRKIGLSTINDLFNVYPRAYLHNAKINELSEYLDKNVIICGRVVYKQLPAKPTHPMKIFISDGYDEIETLVWGNIFYRSNQFKLNEKYIFWGKVTRDNYNFGLKFELRDHIKCDENDEDMMKYPLIPVYILSEELKKTWVKPLQLTKIIFNVLKQYSNEIKEVLSEDIIKSYGLISHRTAVLRTHYPRSVEDIETSRQTLAFEELFFIQLVNAIRKKSDNKSGGISFKNLTADLQKKIKDSLGFELTNAQKRVIKEIISDMSSPFAMNRLLQGDVGSGKTIVAIYAIITAIENGYQIAFMCPTEILAEQHYNTLNKYLDKLGIKSVILTGSQSKKHREKILHEIKQGIVQAIVGTHALFQEAVEFSNLGLVVIDEQHKFGVMQRAKIRQKGLNPDVLVMTATPIPRTLALTIYGDLDLSVIDEMPENRKSIKTALRCESDRIKVYDFLRNEIKNGRQAYIVYPIIEESEKTDIKSAIKHYEILKKDIFPDLRLNLVHGKMKWYEINEVIEEFRKGNIDILVATTVIEVGIDIPNATIMIIEEAQRFGLSQLHQLRGRVGRGAEQSYCILMADDINNVAYQRLNIMTTTTDGFKIAEEDMKLRGPGEFFGTRQSGELKFSAADLSKDSVLLEKAREAAFRVAEEDTHLRTQENLPIRQYFMSSYRDAMELIKIG